MIFKKTDFDYLPDLLPIVKREIDKKRTFYNEQIAKRKFISENDFNLNVQNKTKEHNENSVILQ